MKKRLTEKQAGGVYGPISKVPSEYSRYELFQVIGRYEDQIEALEAKQPSAEAEEGSLPVKPAAAKHYLFGEYVLTEIENAFNSKKSYWLSHQHNTRAVYCFSATTQAEAEEQMEHIQSYIEMYHSIR